MALPFFNFGKTREFQDKSIKNQVKMQSTLGRVETWLSDTYELHDEHYKFVRENMMEQRNLLKKQRFAGTITGAAAGTTVEGGGGGGVGAAAAAVAAAGLSVLGLKKVWNFLKGGSKVDDAIKAASKADDVAKAASKVDDAAKAAGKAANKLDDVAKAASKGKPGFLKDALDKIDDRFKAGSAADDAAKAGKVADDLLPASKASRIFAKIFPPLTVVEAIASNAKDGWDVASAALDDDIATEIQGEDLGGIIGGAIGGAIGVVGGPLGIALGASLGNMVGEWVGDYFDPNFDKEFKESSAKLDAERESLNATLADLQQARADGMMSEESYLKQRKEIEEKLNVNAAIESERAQVESLFSQREEAAKRYNKLKAKIDEYHAKGIEVDESTMKMLENAEKAFEAADKTFDAAAEKFAKPLKSAEAKGIYGSKFLREDKIDTARLGELSANELQAIIDENDINAFAMRDVKNELARRTGGQVNELPTLAKGLQQAFNTAKTSGDGAALNDIIANVTALGGQEAVAALTTGTLTDSMLNQTPTQSNAKSVSAAIPSDSSLGINFQSYASKIGERESSNNYKAVNTIGYVGKYQLGAMALEDIGLVKPGTGKKGNKALDNDDNWVGGLSKEKFLNSPEIQEQAMLAYTKKNMGYLRAKGVITGSESKEQIAGLLAAAHLTGWSGAKALKMGEVKEDQYGSKSSEYYNIGVGSQSGGSVGPSGTGSVSGGSSGSVVNSVSTAQGASGGVTVIDNSSTVVDNSTKSSSSTTNAIPPKARRDKSLGVANDMVLGPV